MIIIIMIIIMVRGSGAGQWCGAARASKASKLHISIISVGRHLHTGCPKKRLPFKFKLAR